MASGNNQSLNIRERSVLAVLLLSAGLLTMAFSNAKRIDKMLINTGKTVSHAVVSVKKELFHADDTSSHHADLKSVEARKEAETPPAAFLRAATPASVDTPGKAKPLDTLKGKLGKLHRGLGRLSGKLDEQKELAKADSINQSRTQNTKPTAPANNAYGYDSKSYNKQDYKSAYKADYKPYHAPTEPSIGEVVTAELKKDGLIDADAPKVSFKLSQSEMIINGVKQPDDVFQKYKKKYVPVTGKNQWTLYNNYDTDTKVTTTDKP
jgi:hypothetical protein